MHHNAFGGRLQRGTGLGRGTREGWGMISNGGGGESPFPFIFFEGR